MNRGYANRAIVNSGLSRIPRFKLLARSGPTPPPALGPYRVAFAPILAEASFNSMVDQGMDFGISHDREDESIEAKARWFHSLSLKERMDLLCSFTELALAVNPNLADGKDAQPIEGRVQVLSLK